MAYQGNQIDYKNLNDELKLKLDKAEGVESQVQALAPKVDNSWQKGVLNNTDIMNLSDSNISRIFYMNDWTAPTDNYEMASIVIPADNFNGTVKVSISGNFNNTNGSGAVEYETSYLKIGNVIHKHSRTIYKADEHITTEYYFPEFRYDERVFTIPVVRRPHAFNRVTVKVEFLTTFPSFELLKNATVVYEDLGTSSVGYPWTPQTTSFIQQNTSNNYYLGGRMTLGGDLYIAKGIPNLTMYVPNSDSGASASIFLNASTTADFGIEYRKNDTTYMHVLGHKDVRFIGHDNVPFSIQDLKQSASDVKTNVAQAITDKGVPTSPDATGAKMAENIRAIPKGRKDVQGFFSLPSIAPYTNQEVTVGTFSFNPRNYCSDLSGVQMCNGIHAQTPNEQMVIGSYFQPIVNNGNGTWTLKLIVKNNTNMTSSPRNVNFLVTE